MSAEDNIELHITPSVDDVLEVSTETFIEWVKVHSAMDDTKKSEELIRSQVFNYLILNFLLDTPLAISSNYESS